jgi:hypothetical protein
LLSLVIILGSALAQNNVTLVERQNYTMSNTNDFIGGSVSYVNTDDTLTKFVVSDLEDPPVHAQRERHLRQDLRV